MKALCSIGATPSDPEAVQRLLKQAPAWDDRKKRQLHGALNPGGDGRRRPKAPAQDQDWHAEKEEETWAHQEPLDDAVRFEQDNRRRPDGGKAAKKSGTGGKGKGKVKSK